MKNRFETIWDWLTKPSAVIKEPEQRYRARLFSALLIPIALGLLPGSFMAPANISLVLKTVMAVLLFCYGLSRTKYYVQAAFLSFLAVSALAPAILPITPRAEQFERIVFTFVWMMPNFLLASLILSLGQTIVFVGLNIIEIGLLAIFLPDFISPATIEAWTYLGIMTALILLASFVRQRYLDQIEQNTLNLAHARDQAVAASRFKSELLAKISHDLRSPLGVILGFAEMVEMGVYGPVTERQRQVMTSIMESTQYQATLIDDLLNQAQIEAGKMKFHPRPFYLAELVEVIQQKMGILAQSKGLSLTCKVDGSAEAPVIGDPDRIQQILMNLVGNAIKFTETGGVQVGFFQPEPAAWAIQVTDTGPGIPTESQAAVFEAFHQVDSSLAHKNQGLGLGLAIVKQLTELMGGEVTLESEVGRGSTFTIILPLQPAVNSPLPTLQVHS